MQIPLPTSATPIELDAIAPMLLKQQFPQAIEFIPIPSAENNWCFDRDESSFAGRLRLQSGEVRAWRLNRVGGEWKPTIQNFP